MQAAAVLFLIQWHLAYFKINITLEFIFFQCPLEWFHYGCVGLQQAPRGKWYCPQCITAMKRRGRK